MAEKDCVITSIEEVLNVLIAFVSEKRQVSGERGLDQFVE